MKNTLQQKNFCIIGLGLLGGSYAMGLSQAGCRVTAVDLSQDAIDWALAHNLIAAGTTGSPAALLAEAEAVVLALYPQTAVAWTRENQQSFRPGTLLTDVCGVKTGVVDAIQGFLRPDVEFIACHPMAGREVSGVQNANTAMFAPANFILTPTEKNTPRGIAFAEALARTLGFARITRLSCAEHDRMIGYVSQLTHAIAVSLMNASDNTHLAEYTGDSFRDLTRIARINDVMWSELFLENRANLSQEIDAFCAALRDVQQKMNDGDREGLRALFRQSTARRALFDRKEP